jgi:hypothetical protein
MLQSKQFYNVVCGRDLKISSVMEGVERSNFSDCEDSNCFIFASQRVWVAEMIEKSL